METIDNEDLLFMVRFDDGYSFRNLIEYLRKTNVDGNFTFSKKFIRYHQADLKVRILNDITINVCDLTDYIYNVKDEEGNEIEEMMIKFNINSLKILTSQLQKKDSLLMYMNKKSREDRKLYVQPIKKKSNSANGGMGFLKLVDINISDVVKWRTDNYSNDEEHPTCTVAVDEFANMCQSIGGIKCDYVLIRKQGNSIHFTTSVDGDISGSSYVFGNYDPSVATKSRKTKFYILSRDNANDVIFMKTGNDIIKSLQKLKNITPNGNLRLTLENGRPFRIISNVGTYGTLKIYISNVVEEN